MCVSFNQLSGTDVFGEGERKRQFLEGVVANGEKCFAISFVQMSQGTLQRNDEFLIRGIYFAIAKLRNHAIIK